MSVITCTGFCLMYSAACLLHVLHGKTRAMAMIKQRNASISVTCTAAVCISSHADGPTDCIFVYFFFINALSVPVFDPTGIVDDVDAVLSFPTVFCRS
jgi:hypothetical protein